MISMKEMIGTSGIVPILVPQREEDAVPACEAVLSCGIRMIEIVLRHTSALASIGQIAKELPNIYLAAGTVLSIDQAKAVLDNGAKAIICPGFDEKMVEFCLQRNVPILPGCVTASEIQKAVGYGLTVLKFFPAYAFGGVETIKAYAGPFPQVEFVVTGGVDSKNLGNYLAYNRILAAGGAWMFQQENALERKAFHEIKRNIHLDIENIQKIRGAMA